MRVMLDLTLLIISNQAFANNFVNGSSRVTYARFEDDRSLVFKKLKSATDQDAFEKCADLGFNGIRKISKYNFIEEFHGGFSYLSTVKMQAIYNCN